jgi:hypothetical protein
MVGVGVAAIKGNSEISGWIIGGGIVGVVLLACQARAEYKHRTYDPTWAFRFDDRFYDVKFKTIRFKAAKILKNNQGKLRRTEKNLDDIDEILDFLEDIGFYAQGDQITPEVAHHHFYHWIRGYYLAARDYIEAWQTKAQEPPRWEHIKELFEITSEIEDESEGKTRLSGEEISEFLDEEIMGCSDKTASSENER